MMDQVELRRIPCTLYLLKNTSFKCPIKIVHIIGPQRKSSNLKNCK